MLGWLLFILCFHWRIDDNLVAIIFDVIPGYETGVEEQSDAPHEPEDTRKKS